VIGLLPIPGPLDEILLLVVALILATFYRDLLRDAWRRTSTKTLATPKP
jgi:hypothetical protein